MRPIIFTGDDHLTAAQPRYRTDDYAQTMLRKWEWVVSQAAEREALLVTTGDLFDKASGPLWFLNAIMRITSRCRGMYGVAGNHDQYHHNPDITRTQLGILMEAGLFQLLDNFPNHDSSRGKSYVNLYGRSWNEEWPELREEYVGKNILVAHATVTKDMPPPWLTAQTAVEVIEANPGFDYIFTGDFHEKFVVEHKGCTLVNTGPLSRASIDKRDFQPSVWLLDDSGLTELPVPIEQDVFDLEILSKGTAESMVDTALLDKFIASLTMDGGKAPSFEELLDKVAAELPEDKAELKLTLKEIMDHVRDC